MEQSSLRFQCPDCGQELSCADQAAYRCRCGVFWPIHDGIPDFTSDQPYYGELPQPQMRELVDKAREEGWRAALFNRFGTQDEFVFHIAADESRGDFRFLLPLQPDWQVLDLGAGWGTLSIPLARDCASVVALDGTLERLQFVGVRCAQDNIRNVIRVRGSAERLPFSSEQFDLVIMNGVLEWVPLGVSGNPVDLQRAALASVSRALKPGGFLYFAIENRYGFKYLLGAPDDHTGVRHIAYLPRREADRVISEIPGHPHGAYRTYTHSFKSYMTLLNEAGFASIDAFFPTPDYKTSLAWLPLDDLGPAKYYLHELQAPGAQGSVPYLQHALEWAAVCAGTLREHANSFSFVCRKEGSRAGAD